jgi:glycosyltransferase involved in cell wall biosynthesis
MESEPSALSGLRISCIVPVHNGEAYLADAIASILAQSHRLIEVIVVDDGSGDRSNAIAHSFGDPVRVVRLDEQRGPGYARASGVAAATGDVIGFLDADDLWLPQKLERQIVHMAGPPRLDVSFCQIENFWVEGFESEAAHWTAMGRTLGPGST